MPRIPQKELDELKRRVSLAALAESQGHKLRQQGRDLVLLCPFHQEQTPSCVISPE
ncbi:CHC2 zinc finger domain-containing protein, partial [Erwinia amylovora]